MSKQQMRKRLAALSFSEKVKILEKLRDRSHALAASGLRQKAKRRMRKNDLELFCRTVRERSRANKAALELLNGAALTGKVIGTLREELDSMIRCIYLLSIRDRRRRDQLIGRFLDGQRWPVTDAKMVGLSNKLQGWTQSVYKFGCAFIHLSKYHDINQDAFESLNLREREQIAHHLSYYHGFRMDADTRFIHIVPILPRVFEKIESNLECYVRDLENNSELRT
jgi:hypothetical protein